MTAAMFILLWVSVNRRWIWYTISPWMYQFIVRYLLGVCLNVDKIYFKPCLPADWVSWKLHYKYRETFYHITFLCTEPSDKVISVKIDGVEQEEMAVRLVDDRIEHLVEVTIG